MSQNIWRNLKYKNVAVSLAVVLLFILLIASSCSKDSSKNKGNIALTISNQERPENAQSKNKLSDNFVVAELDSGEMYSGNLILVNKDHEYAYKDEEPENLASMFDYRTNKKGKLCFVLTDSSVSVSQNFAVALKNMLFDFYKSSKNNNIMLDSGYRTVNEQQELYDYDTELSGNESTKYNKPGYSESHTGLSIDLKLNIEGYPKFKGTGKFKWIPEHAAEYGIITRYTKDKELITNIEAEPWHLRYVGVPHAEIMVSNNLCLEEYHDYIKGYSYDKPLIFTASDNIKYGIYFIKATKDKTTIKIPLNENDEQYEYNYSGNNVDGFIVTVNLGEDTEAIAKKSAATTEANKTEAAVNNNTQPTQATSSGNSDSVITAPTTTIKAD